MGEWDIIAVCDVGLWLIQAKCNGWGSKRERDELAAFPAYQKALKMIWRKDDRKPAPIIYTYRNDTWAVDIEASANWQHKRQKAIQNGKKNKRRETRWERLD